MAKMGRPTANPKGYLLSVRLDRESMEVLERYCMERGVGKGEAIREAIKNLRKE